MKNTKPILFSGVQPTGKLHIGNYLGAIKNWVDLQNSNEYQTIFSIVDLHSLTQDYEVAKKSDEIYATLADYLACGIDPKKSIIFLQSHVKEHTELAWIFNCITPVAELERMTQYKDKAERQKDNINMGLFDYPVLMAADILLYKAEVVPVGEDQVQHVELTRIVARKFNNRWGKTFEEPKSKLTRAARLMALNDPMKKMSKSLGEKSYIALSDTPEEIAAKIKSAVTTPEGGRNLIDLLRAFSDDNKLINKFEKEITDGTIRYSELKEILSKAIIDTLKPIQEKRAKLLTNKKYLDKILKHGAKQAEKIAQKNMTEFKKKIGLI